MYYFDTDLIPKRTRNTMNKPQHVIPNLLKKYHENPLSILAELSCQEIWTDKHGVSKILLSQNCV